jgi:hypothetical protein
VVDDRSPPACPWCGHHVAIPFVYGELLAEYQARAERGEVVLGVGVVDEERPRWRCKECGYDFGRLGDVTACFPEESGD